MRLSAILLTACFVVAGCGSDEEGSTSPGTGGSGGTAGAAGSTGGTGAVSGSGGSSGVSGQAGGSGSGGTSQDAGPDVEPDASEDASPDGAVDAEAGVDVPLDGMGDLTGQCGELDDADWNASVPFLLRNAIDFGTEGFVEAELSPGGAEVLADGNLNPNSLHSEVMAYEVLYRCELAELLATENEVEYEDPGGKKTDLVVLIDGRRVGVSVTRAYHYPSSDPYSVPEATTLLAGKLSDIPLAAENAKPAEKWERSMLHVMAYGPQYADSIETAWSQLDATVRADTILVVTVTEGEDEFIY